MPVSQLARVSLPVTVMVLPFFTGSGEALTVSLEKRWTRTLETASRSSSWPSLAPAAAPTRHQVASELSIRPGVRVMVPLQVVVVALTTLQETDFSFGPKPKLSSASTDEPIQMNAAAPAMPESSVAVTV